MSYIFIATLLGDSRRFNLKLDVHRGKAHVKNMG
jgi:hypothetical protein